MLVPPPPIILSGCKAILISSTFSSQNIHQLGIVVDCWQFTYSYEILKRFVNHHINTKVWCWSQISFSEKLIFAVRNVCGLTLNMCPRVKQVKSESNSFSDHLLFHRPSHIRSPIHQSLEIIYGFCLDARENRLCYTNTLLHTKVKWYQLFMINTVNQ